MNLQAYLRPELLNRPDKLLRLKQLGMGNTESIAGLLAADACQRMNRVKHLVVTLAHTCILVQAYFRPELLNRLDEIVVFKQLAMANTAAIAELLMQETRERIAVRGIGLEVSSSLMRFICQEGYSEVRDSSSPHSEDRSC